MFPIVVTKTLAAASANNIALSQTPTSGAALTINGSTATAGVATLDTQRRVLLTFGNEVGDRTLVVTGTNQYGTTISETLAIASGSASTIYTLYDYLTVTSLLPLGGGWSNAVTVGTNGIGSTSWISVSSFISPVNVNAVVTTSGTVTPTVEWTPNLIVQTGLLPYSIPTPQTLTLTSNVGNVTWPCQGVRLTITAGTGTATAVFTQAGVSQAG